MADIGSTRPDDAGRELVLTRVFDAPRELVFAAWTDPRHVAQWWGPRGFDNPVCEVDARPGGAMRIDMRGPDGTLYPMTGVFEEVVPPERLVFLGTAVADSGEPLIRSRTTVAFEQQGSKTSLTVHVVVIKATAAAAAVAGMEEGWGQSLDRLAALIAAA